MLGSEELRPFPGAHAWKTYLVAVSYPSSTGFDAVSVDPTVAISAERDQVFVSVVTQSAPRANVVDLKTI
jgi:hypothetical protein